MPANKMGDIFTTSFAVGYILSPAPRADFINELLRPGTRG